MKIPFQTIHWAEIQPTEHKGESGIARWKTIEKEGLRIRMVEYEAGYLADHWCEKGHFVQCLSGEFETELSTGERIKTRQGEGFLVSDNLSSHRSFSENGVLLLIVDGDFLK